MRAKSSKSPRGRYLPHSLADQWRDKPKNRHFETKLSQKAFLLLPGSGSPGFSCRPMAMPGTHPCFTCPSSQTTSGSDSKTGALAQLMLLSQEKAKVVMFHPRPFLKSALSCTSEGARVLECSIAQGQGHRRSALSQMLHTLNKGITGSHVRWPQAH